MYIYIQVAAFIFCLQVCFVLGCDKRFREWARPVDSTTEAGSEYIAVVGSYIYIYISLYIYIYKLTHYFPVYRFVSSWAVTNGSVNGHVPSTPPPKLALSTSLWLARQWSSRGCWNA